jgi:HK97 gp10 family phage protein
MASLPKDIKKQVRRQLKEAADVVVLAAKELAPVDTGHLKSMIRSRQASWSKDGMFYEIVSTTIYNNSSAGPYPSFQEFGTVHNKAHPYLFPALRATKSEVERIVKRAIYEGLEKANPSMGL